jgi:integrase
MEFSARAAKALTPGEHLIVPDAPGLRLVATETKRTWTYRYKSPVDGAMRQVKLGSWPAMGLPAALAAWHPMKTARDAGGDPAAEKKQRRAQAVAQAEEAALTVRKVCDDYLSWLQRRVTPKTHGEAKRLLDRDIDAIAARPAASITRADAFQAIESKSDAPVVAVMLRQHLGAAWDRALDAGELPPDVPNWWRLVLRGKLASKGKKVAGKAVGAGKRVLSNAEAGALVRWLPNHTRDMEDILTLYLWTCCRGAEIVAMERSEVGDEADGLWWTIPKAKLKMRRNPMTTDLRVPLIGRAEVIVRRRLAASPGQWLFPSHGRSGHIEQKAVGVAVWAHRPASKAHPEWQRPRFELDDWAPHDLRRTGRTMLAALGCPEEVAEAILGHLLPGIVGTYNLHTYDAERRQWLTRLSAHLEQCAGQDPARRR